MPADGELAKIRDGMAELSVKPGVQKHLVVVGHGLASQFSRANRQVPNKEYVPVILEHSDGYHRIASLLTKHDPRHVGELAYVIGDAELGPIRALPVASRAERSLVERRTQGLIGSIVAAVGIGLDLKGDPNVSIFLWDELKKGPDDLSERLSRTLIDVFQRDERVQVLSQFQRDTDGNIDPETEVIRKLWHSNATQYRPIGTDGKSEGWSRPAQVMMCQAILTGALRHVAKRRLRTAQQEHVDVKLTATIADDGAPLSAAQKAERTHAFILHSAPTERFLRHKHKEMAFDANARTVIRNAANSRPTDPVVIGYAGKMSAAAKSIGESLDPAKGDSSHSVADFGRLPFAPLHAATAGLASSAMGMQDASRFNFNTLVSKVTTAAKCRDKHSKAAMNITTTDLIVHVAALAHLFFKEMGARPDVYPSRNRHVRLRRGESVDVYERTLLHPGNRTSGAGSNGHCPATAHGV